MKKFILILFIISSNWLLSQNIEKVSADYSMTGRISKLSKELNLSYMDGAKASSIYEGLLIAYNKKGNELFNNTKFQEKFLSKLGKSLQLSEEDSELLPLVYELFKSDMLKSIDGIEQNNLTDESNDESAEQLKVKYKEMADAEKNLAEKIILKQKNLEKNKLQTHSEYPENNKTNQNELVIIKQDENANIQNIKDEEVATSDTHIEVVQDNFTEIQVQQIESPDSAKEDIVEIIYVHIDTIQQETDIIENEADIINNTEPNDSIKQDQENLAQTDNQINNQGENIDKDTDKEISDNENLPSSGNVISASELEEEEESQDMSGLLQSSEDIFVSTAGYSFGPARFRIRGYDSRFTSVMLNGINANDVETNRAYWSSWGGLNDATRNKVVDYGISPVSNNFGGIGGVSDIITRASSFNKGVKATYSATNRSYRNRVMFTASTGLMPNNWAVSFSGSRRWAQEGYVEGTFYDAWSYFLAIEKKINNNHSLGLTFFGAPTINGKSSVATQEVYDLTGTNFYNSNWGYQDGEKRNARVGNFHKPMIILNHYWDLNEKTDITSGIGYSFGRGGTTALNWYDASHPSELGVYTNVLDPGYNDPRPDYYRFLPSYWDEENETMFNLLTDAWQNDENFRQLNWDYFYFANRKNLYSVEDAEGTLGNDITGNRSKYIIEDRRNDHSRIDFSSSFINHLTDKIDLSGGLNINFYKGYHFKVVEDLLGGDYWLDIDQFAERDFPGEEAVQSNLDNPNHVVYEGDRFGYDYVANVNNYNLYAQSEFSYEKIDLYFGAKSSFSEFWRTGNMRNGTFPNNSLGDSEKQSFLNYGVKAGANYKSTGRHFITLNGAYYTQSPNFMDSYISPRTRDHIVDGLTSEKILSGDISYIIRTPYLKTRITGYYTSFNDEVYNRSFYHEELNSFVNYIMTDLNKLNTGIELGIEAKLTQTITFTGVAAKGNYIYNSRPKVTISQDNNYDIIVENRTVYLENYKIGGFPQSAYSAGFKYWSAKYWFAGFNFNYYDDIYLDVNPDRRTIEALQGDDENMQGIVISDPQWNEMLAQEKLDPGFTVDIYGGKSWKIKDYYINLNVSMNNLLNNQELAIGGYEQLRFDRLDLGKFPSKYFYLYGRGYYVNLSFRF
ncbi:MAG: TonB-dependent receptor plug domain-containing protein [Bacteroidota bacterium]